MEMAAVSIAKDTPFFAVTTEQADRSNGGLHGLQTTVEVMLEVRIRELALGLYSGVGIFKCALVVGHREKGGAVLQK
jgi:hypothetical protein